MAVSIRGRSSRRFRMRGRTDSGEETVPLDLLREPSDNTREILQNVSKTHGVSNTRKLGHLNNFTKLVNSVGHQEQILGFTYQEIIICLRVTLLNEVKEVRAAGLRALRYLLRDITVLHQLLHLHIDYLISRCIDIQQNNEVERTQALRLIRKMLAMSADLFPRAVTSALIAVASDGLQQGDNMVLACNAIICELALRNPQAVAVGGGLGALLKNVLDSQQSRINEALITTILHLLNHPHTRQYVRADVELEQILAPYTDFHYRHNPDTTEAQLKKDRESRFLASKMAIVSAFRSWSGIINLCKKALLEVLYEIFRLPVPMVTVDFDEALRSIEPSRLQDSWRLADGFVVAEAKVILPHPAKSRPDLMDNYLALVLSALINSGLLEGLVEVVTSSDDDISVRATILLGELLHMASSLLPHSHSHHLHCLPTLINMAASFDISAEKRLRASAAVTQLKRLHERKKRGLRPHSLYLQLILHQSANSQQRRDPHRTYVHNHTTKDTEDALIANIRDSQVLNHKHNLDWNWVLISTVLTWPNSNLRNCKDEQMHRFVRRLLYFYKPSSNLYSHVPLEDAKATQLTVAGCQLIDILLESGEEGLVHVEDLLKDIVFWLANCAGFKSEHSLQSNGLLTTLSQHYFLFLGTLSAQALGIRMMEKCGVFQCLLNLCSLKNQDHLLKLTVSTLDYSRDGLARVILSKILTAASDNCRLYATKHLRVLLRANVEFFSSWGVELLVTQLHDLSNIVSMEALDILDEACEEKANLHALIHMKPALAHLGDKGHLLQLRFLSVPKGFVYLNDRGYISKQLEKWSHEYNLKYVDMLEEQMNEALTTYCKPVDGDNYVRRTNQRLQRPSVYLPVHLYGQLVYDKTGCVLLETQNVVPDLSYTVRSAVLDKWEEIKRLKAALWALANIGSSNWGVALLQEEGVVPHIITLAHHCEVLSVRGTCVYVLGVISRTRAGSDLLQALGWDSVRHGRRHKWPVAPDDVDSCAFGEMSSIPSMLSLNSDSSSSRHNSESEGQASLCSKPLKERSAFTLLSSSRLMPNRLLTSLTSPELRDPLSGSGRSPDSHPCSQCRMRTLSEPRPHSPGPTLGHGDRSLLRLEILRDGGERDFEVRGECRAVTTGSQDGLACDSSSSLPGGAMTFKSRSQSFTTDTTTSGISSLSSSPSRETAPTVAVETDRGSLSTVVSATGSPVAPGRPHTLPRRAQSLRSATPTACASPRDALGYATLKRLKQQRMHLPNSDTLTSPAKDVLFTDTITMKTHRQDTRLTPRRCLEALSFMSLDKENLLSPINHSTLHSVLSSATCGSTEDYIGLALPVDITSIFHVRESSYLQNSSPTEGERQLFLTDSDRFVDSCRAALKQRVSITELLNSSRMEQRHLVGREESTGLQEHTEQNCLYCSALTALDHPTHAPFNITQTHTDLSDGFSQWPAKPFRSQLEVVAQSNLSGVSGCSDTAVSHNSNNSTPTNELLLGGKVISEDGPVCRVLLRKEIVRLVVNLSSSVATKSHETGLLTIKEKFACVFDDVCLYSEVSLLLAHCRFRLLTRRFIQELFQDVHFLPLYEEAEAVLSKPVKTATNEPSLDCSSDSSPNP
ncbi:rapamycin-insensitive companion of mTOR isoform X3 [Brachyhypopomus gauderio]|uniref:rapamycin-insensitive companion of mTOR isoform X3 n=1 Tax=Brachyhypopomus gauderio TaxID=698409 RepID=UPI0040418872